MENTLVGQSLLYAAIFSVIVLIIFWFEYRRIRSRLMKREEQMKHRMYELSILREIGERIGYSLNVHKIVDVITGSLGRLLPYSAVAYMLPEEAGRIVFNISLAEAVNKHFVTDVRGRMLKAFAVLFGKTYVETDVDESISGAVTDPTNTDKVQSSFNVPIVINGRAAGILTVASTETGLYHTSEEVEVLYTIVNQASDAVSKLQTVLEIEKGKDELMAAKETAEAANQAKSEFLASFIFWKSSSLPTLYFISVSSVVNRLSNMPRKIIAVIAITTIFITNFSHSIVSGLLFPSPDSVLFSVQLIINSPFFCPTNRPAVN